MFKVVINIHDYLWNMIYLYIYIYLTEPQGLVNQNLPKNYQLSLL